MSGYLTPRTWTDAELVVGQYGNDWRDDMDYFRGAQPGTGAATIKAPSGAAAGATAITVTALDDLPSTIPEGTVLAFGTGVGAAKFARTTAEVLRGATSVPVAALETAISSGDFAYYPAQTESEINNVPLWVATGIGFPAAVLPGIIKAQFTAGESVEYRFLAQHASAVSNNDSAEWVFYLRKTDGTEEKMARIRAIRLFLNTYAVYVYAAESGAFHTDPDVICYSGGQVWIGNPSVPVGTLDINGDLDADGYAGLALWQEFTAGTAQHNGAASVTDQLRSTVATGTPPLQAAPDSDMVLNLNSEFLQGSTWPGAPDHASGSVSVVTPATLYTVASTIFTEAGLHIIRAQATATMAAADAGAKFSLTVPGMPRSPGIKELTTSFEAPWSLTALYNAAASESLFLKASKDAGGGSTSVAGSIMAERYGK